MTTIHHDADALVLDSLRVTFGGLVAVDALDLRAPIGAITGLIGPNGAGKSTAFNACSGFIKPTSGTIRFGPRDLTAQPPTARAGAGIGRTFQHVELFDSLTVAENVSLGYEAGIAGTSPWTQLVSRRLERRRRLDVTASSLELCGISDLADHRAGELATGVKRLVELARALAGDFKVLLLDEPSSGLDVHESTDFGRLLRTVQAERAIGIVLVEHDMSLIADVCDYVYVLDFGKLIFEGDPTTVLASEVVKAAYLGSDPAAVAPGPVEP